MFVYARDSIGNNKNVSQVVNQNHFALCSQHTTLFYVSPRRLVCSRASPQSALNWSTNPFMHSLSRILDGPAKEEGEIVTLVRNSAFEKYFSHVCQKFLFAHRNYLDLILMRLAAALFLFLSPSACEVRAANILFINRPDGSAR